MKVTCLECQNEFDIEQGIGTGDTIECPFCGIELEYKGKDKSGKIKLEIIEEEK
ncbi:MAG: lysine biosynthesis protein LysW [Patescibacteria group bacterium]|jgi:DNA-directed RNA polymerase subunit RPC12/RpoP